jgi:FAD/FMN-containing dehydrogenase
LRLGGRVMKNVAGFDLVRAMSGSRGRLGVIREVVLRLTPLPEAHRVLTLDLSDPPEGAGGVGETVRRLVMHPVLPAALVREAGPLGSRLRIRLLGSDAVVASDTEELLEMLPGASVWEGPPPGAGFWRRDPIGSVPAPDGPLMEIRGGGLGATEVDEAIAGLGAVTGSVRQIPLWHVWRVALEGTVPHDLEAAIGDLAERLRASGGDLAFLRGGPARWRPGAGVSRDVEALEGRVVAAILGTPSGSPGPEKGGSQASDVLGPEKGGP